MTTERREQVPFSAAVTSWSDVFDLSGASRHRCENLAHAVKVRRDDILTAKLQQTVKFYRAAESNKISLLPGCIGDLKSVLDILCTLATFDNLARSDFASIKNPIFWLRLGGETPTIAPALPLNMAAKLCGLEISLLRASLVSLIKDGAVEIVKSPEGVVAVVVKPGFINDSHFKRHFRA